MKTKKIKAHPLSLHPHHSGSWLSTDGDLQAKFVSCHNRHRVVGEVQALQVHPRWVCRYDIIKIIKLGCQCVKYFDLMKHVLRTNDVNFGTEAL